MLVACCDKAVSSCPLPCHVPPLLLNDLTSQSTVLQEETSGAAQCNAPWLGSNRAVSALPGSPLRSTLSILSTAFCTFPLSFGLGHRLPAPQQHPGTPAPAVPHPSLPVVPNPPQAVVIFRCMQKQHIGKGQLHPGILDDFNLSSADAGSGYTLMEQELGSMDQR